MEDVFISFRRGFPFDEVAEIGKSIEDAKIFVPGYIPPEVGLMDLRGFMYTQEYEQYDVVILPDRNLVSRMARAQRDGMGGAPDQPMKNAVNVLAFAKAMDMLMEPSIAFHELAHHGGSDLAYEELAWFRTADNHDTWEWIEAALGRRSSFSASPQRHLGEDAKRDLSYPLNRWRRNYIVALKIAELELKPLPHIEKALQLLHWLYQDFLLAGPAALFASLYFSPNGSRKRLIKYLRSPDRDRAIEGAKNAAWDITYLSDFAERVLKSEQERRRYIFATSDKSLARVAPLLVNDLYDLDGDAGLAAALGAWWPQGEAKRIVSTLIDYMSRSDAPDRHNNQPAPADFIDRLTECGEECLRSSKL
ncbi:hypothetical protein MHY87_15120 [Microvirga sp. ACRRW]|uniref:hypothetical protein n=1 Tax=Microvirga sp. ACRRW TaxID=2918205 RepID=UPI001EF6E69B|nr:hypothetical protein [Microvirga sp. ACRRW]MCG7394236.1 hypothetical protein [Microvirga sp. ACRRW]